MLQKPSKDSGSYTIPTFLDCLQDFLTSGRQLPFTRKTSLAQSSFPSELEDCRLSLQTAEEQRHHNNHLPEHILKHSHTETSDMLRSRKGCDKSWMPAHTWALGTAGVLCAGGVLTEKRWTHFSLTEDTATVACALCARVNVPCLSFYKGSPTRSMTD